MREPDKNLELLIHQRLRALPEVRAPQELIPSVLGRISAKPSLSWWKQPWLEWPLVARMVSAALLVGGLAGACWQEANVTAFVRHSNPMAARLFTAADAISDALAGAMQYLLHLLLNPWCLLAGGVGLALYLGVAALSILFYQIAVEQPSNNR